MKKKLLVFLLLFVITPAFAANWVKLNKNGVTVYVDSEIYSDKYDKNITYYWVKYIKKTQKYNLYMSSNCQNDFNKIIKTVVYDSNGKVIRTQNNNEDYSPVNPDSTSAIAHNYVCDLLAQHEEEQAEIERQKQAEEQAKQQQNQKNETIKNLINTGVGVGLHFLNY